MERRGSWEAIHPPMSLAIQDPGWLTVRVWPSRISLLQQVATSTQQVAWNTPTTRGKPHSVGTCIYVQCMRRSLESQSDTGMYTQPVIAVGLHRHLTCLYTAREQVALHLVYTYKQTQPERAGTRGSIWCTCVHTQPESIVTHGSIFGIHIHLYYIAHTAGGLAPYYLVHTD